MTVTLTGIVIHVIDMAILKKDALTLAAKRELINKEGEKR